MVDSQRRLYNLGLFNEVDMAVQNPDGQEPSKDVLFNLQEAKRWTFRYGGGIEFATGNIPTTNNPTGKTGVSPERRAGDHPPEHVRPRSDIHLPRPRWVC